MSDDEKLLPDETPGAEKPWRDRNRRWSRLTIEQRFWEKVDTSGECWEWQAARAYNGYGLFTANRWRQFAHRAAWALSHGRPVPNGLHVLHTCDNRACVRPSHLWLGTRSDNMQDMHRKGRGFIGTDRKGEGNPRAKLSWRDVRWIRKAWAARIATQPQIAARFGISRASVSGIVTGKTWAVPR
jgi:hypothetical protein